MQNGINVTNSLPKFRKEWLSADIVAGLTTAAVVIPKAMAYATVAGLPVIVGLYTCFLPMVIYAFFGSSRPLSVSTTTTLAILTAAELNLVAPNGDVAAMESALVTLTLMVGAILMVASILRLGFVANFISEPVLVGFKAGIGLVIVVDQIPKLLGIHFDKGSFLHNIFAIVGHLPELSIASLLVGVVMIVLLVGIEHFAPRAPAPLIAVAAGIAGMSLLGLQQYGVSIVGNIPKGLPSFHLPDLSIAAQLWPGALGIALMSFTESIAAGRVFATNDEPTPKANRELLATGLANLGGALLGSMPAGGGTSQTAVNRLAGARTQLSELVTAGGTLVTMLFLAPLVAQMPNATLAAVVIVYSIGLVNPAEFRAILKIRRTEFAWAIAALIGVVALGTLQGILVAIVISLVALSHQAADPPVYVLGRKPGTNVFRKLTSEHPEDETFPGLLMIRTEGRIFFANAEVINLRAKHLIEAANPKVVLFDFRAVPDLEYTALKMFIEAEKRLAAAGIQLWLVGLNPQVLAVIQRSPLHETLGRDRLLFNLESAIDHYQATMA